MSKKNRSPWRKINAQAEPEAGYPRASVGPPTVSTPEAPASADFSPISPAQLAANRANALLSTGPRTEAGLAKSSQNAVKSALTGRTVLLPTDDIEEYSAFLAEFQRDLKPVGARECELVQIVVDCHWRLRRIQELEYALYAHGEEQFAERFADLDPLSRRSKIVLQTHLTYEKQLRNLHIQEARLDRKRRNALAELHEMQEERRKADSTESLVDPLASNLSEEDHLALFEAGYIPPSIAANLAKQQALNENGFVFSNGGSGAES